MREAPLRPVSGTRSGTSDIEPCLAAPSFRLATLQAYQVGGLARPQARSLVGVSSTDLGGDRRGGAGCSVDGSEPDG